MGPVILSCLSLVVALTACLRAFYDHFYYKKRLGAFHCSLKKLRRALKDRGDLANEIAHEIKNPITAILCSAETLDLLIGEEIDPMHRQSLRFIKEYGDNLLRLVSDFLDLSRAESGNISASPEMVVVKDVVESVAGLLRSNAMRKQINLRVLITDWELKAYVDPRHIKQVVFNLVHNAIKFTPVGGEVQVEVKSCFPAGEVNISVKDNGPGIPEEKAEKIFNPYISDGTSDAGAGIGLALCKHLVELAGGRIKLESKEGLGSSFEVFIPAVRDLRGVAIDDSQEIDVTSQRPLEGQRFLIVDENVGAREAVARLLEAWGAMVDRVSLAAEAVAAVGRKKYTTILIDDSVDGLHCFELARLIREDCRDQDLKIIVAARSQHDRAEIKKAGINRCISKPFNGKALFSSVAWSGTYELPN
ncbi:MAG: hybrid sensor histidine kinase/response regulator [Candidatus Dadabacteria bacterium]|nr:MAG: hybrid sensor histidine kinase/response regulator [Candidatus Dadabacteria bacterium]